MFNNAPIASPASAAISSVASVNKADKGTIARALQLNTSSGCDLVRYVAAPIGTNMRREFSHEDNRISRSCPVSVALFSCFA